MLCRLCKQAAKPDWIAGYGKAVRIDGSARLLLGTARVYIELYGKILMCMMTLVKPWGTAVLVFMPAWILKKF